MRVVWNLAALLALTTAAHAAEMVEIPVLNQRLGAGEKVEPAMIAMKSVPANHVYASTITSTNQLTDVQATRPLRPDMPLNRLHVKPAMDIQRNSVVTLIYRKPGLELTGSGTALQEGRIGGSIKVLNPESRATLTGRVISANTVEIR